MLAGNAEGLGGQVSRCAGIARGAKAGSHLRPARSDRCGPTPARATVLGFLNSAPAQVIDHLARNPLQQVRIGVAQEIEHDAPLALRGRGLAIGRCPAFERRFQPALHDVRRDALRDGVDELAFFFEERAFVGARHLLAVRDLDGAHVSPCTTMAALCTQRRPEICRLDCQVFKDDPRLTLVWDTASPAAGLR